MREDLKPAVQVVQAAHAALESAYRFPLPRESEPFLVVLGVANELELAAAQERITRKGIGTYLFYEPDNELGHTAIATEPITSNQKRKVFFPYALLHAEVAQREHPDRITPLEEVGGSEPSLRTNSGDPAGGTVGRTDACEPDLVRIE